MELVQLAPTRTVLCILHHPRSSLGVVGQWLYEYGVKVVSLLGRNTNFATLDADQFDAIIVFGPVGPKLRFWPTRRTDGERRIK